MLSVSSEMMSRTYLDIEYFVKTIKNKCSENYSLNTSVLFKGVLVFNCFWNSKRLDQCSAESN